HDAPVVASSPSTLTRISTDVWNAAVIRAVRRTTWPTWIGLTNARSSMPAVMAMWPVWRCAQMAAHRSTHARIWPPNTLPSALACVGSTYSVIVVIESATRFIVTIVAPLPRQAPHVDRSRFAAGEALCQLGDK